MSDIKYNGWTNYATWRVNMEMFNGKDYASKNNLDAYELSYALRTRALDRIDEQAKENSLVLSYAEAFLSDVNWYELAEHQIKYYRKEKAA